MDWESGVSTDLENRLDKHREVDHTGTLVLSENEGFVGDTIEFKGRNLSPNTKYNIMWHSSVGKWGVLKGNEVIGPQYQPRTDRIMSASTDEDGRFEEEWEIPEDYGGEHRIEVQTTDGETQAESEFTISPWFELERTSAALGETFTVIGHGLGTNFLQSNYQVTWDNGMVGFMTGVLNRGLATAEIRAVGPIGEHPLQVWRNFRGVPFLQNNTQSPFGPVGGGRQSTWTVEVTEPDPETEMQTAWVDSMWDESPLAVHFPDLDEDTDAELGITPTSGQPGTDAFIQGRNFPPDTSVDLIWHTHEGHRIEGVPITPERMPEVLPTVTTDEDGTFEVEITIPRDIGATRPITAEVNGRSVAVTGFMMQPKVEGISPTSGPVGTDIKIEMSGIGWPIYENAYHFVYDNRPIGYICGLDLDDDDGIVRTVLQAAGEPGHHFIDVYPGLFDMRDDKPNFVLKPHLSHANNHPVRPLPALHFTFEVTE